MSKEYVNVSGAAVNITAGQMLAPGVPTDKVDPKDDHDKALIEAGTLIPAETGDKEKS